MMKFDDSVCVNSLAVTVLETRFFIQVAVLI